MFTLANRVLLMVITDSALLPLAAGWYYTSIFSRLSVRPKSFDASEKQLSASCKSESSSATNAQS